MKGVRLLVALVALPLAAAACGGAAPAGSRASEQTADDQLVEFTKCMREHGVDVDAESDGDGRFRIAIGGPAGGSDGAGGKGGPDPKMEEAMKACEDKMPKAGPDLTPEERAELEDQMLEFAKCMREHGIDMPDPGEGGFIQKFAEGEGSANSKPTSEEFKAAEEACADKLPNRNVERGVSREEAN